MSIPMTAVINNKPGRVARWLGARWREDRGMRFIWGEWSRRWGLCVELINWGEDGDWSLKIMLIFGVFFIKLPFLPARQPRDMMDCWGFTWSWSRYTRAADIHCNWGSRCKIVHLPWDYVHVRSDMLCDDGTWQKKIGSWERKEGDRVPAIEVHPYRYVCRNGQVQDVQATISVGEMEWRWRATRLLPWPRMIRRSIEIKFDQEVGEKRGSWKGGCRGCGYDMRPDETPAECLRRMQRTRRFD